MATWYAKVAGDWFAANAWNSLANGSGTDATAPLTATDNADLNGLAMTVTTGATITQAAILATTGTFTPAGTLTINGNVTYSGTSTSGMLIVGTGANVTINGTVTASAAGYCVYGSGSGVCTISNSGGTAVSITSSGRGVDWNSTGNLTSTGALSGSGTGRCLCINATATVSSTGNISITTGIGISVTAGSPTITSTGDATSSSSGSCYSMNGGTLTVDGNMSGSGVQLNLSGGTATWTGNRSIAASADCYIAMTGSPTLNLATASAKLVLSNSGTIQIRKTGGTINTADAGAGAAQINLQTSTSYASIVGGTDANKAIIVGPTLPAAGDVDDTADDFGYPAALVEPTFKVPPASKVEDDYQYGAGGTEYTGTLAAGYTYGDADPTKVLTTATGAGTYQPVAASAVQKDVAVGVSPAVGTLVGIVDSSGSQHAYGTCSSAQAWAAAGIVHTSGTAAASGILNTGGDYAASGVFSGGAGTIYETTGLAVGQVLDSVATWRDGDGDHAGTYHAPDAGEVISTAVFGPSSGTSGTYDVSNVAAENIKDGILIGGVEGTYDPMDAAVFPAEANVSTVETAYGPTGAEYAGSLDLSLYTLISGVAGASDVRSGVARYSGGGNGTCVVPAAADVQFGVNVDATTGTFVVPLESTVQDSVTYGAAAEFTGTYNPMAAAVFPAESNVSTVESAYGPTGAEYAGSLNLGLYVLISNVVAAAWVVVGQTNYAGGDAGEYPTTETSKAAQLADDQAAVLAQAASIKDDATILGQAGTYDFTAAIAAGYASGEAAQLVTDTAAVNADKASINNDTTILGVTGTQDLATLLDGAYDEGALDQSVLDIAEVNTNVAHIELGEVVLTGSNAGTLVVGGGGIDPGDIVSAAWVVVGHDNYVGGSAGTYPTTATSQAAQLATDRAAVTAAAEHIDGDATILGVEGTGMTAAEVEAAVTAGIVAASVATSSDVATIIAAIGTPQQSGVAVTLPATAPAGYGGGADVTIVGTNVVVEDS